MQSSFNKIVKKFEKKKKNGKNVFLFVSDPKNAVMSGLHEDVSLDTLLVYNRNDGNEALSGFIKNNPINENQPIRVLLDLEEDEFPSIYFENDQDREKLGEDTDDLLVIFCEFKQYSFFFYVFNTKDMQIGIKNFNHNKLTNTQFFKHSFLNTLPDHEKKATELLLFPSEESSSEVNSYGE